MSHPTSSHGFLSAVDPSSDARQVRLSIGVALALAVATVLSVIAIGPFAGSTGAEVPVALALVNPAG